MKKLFAVFAVLTAALAIGISAASAGAPPPPCMLDVPQLVTSPTLGGAEVQKAPFTGSVSNGVWSTCHYPITGYQYEWSYFPSGGSDHFISGATHNTFLIGTQYIGDGIHAWVSACNYVGCSSYAEATGAYYPTG